ncbi:MAG: ATP-binding cassette domain-containing protein [Candidatus Margulisiibacteriota bacterium]
MGTVRDNISRMQKDVDDQLVIDAAKQAGVHEIILNLPNGYETNVGLNGHQLSAGQRQRIGLARAFFNSPGFVVLDEPNSNLDQEGDQALANALLKAKENKTTVIVISHRKAIYDVIDKLMVIQNGTAVLYDDKETVLEKLNTTVSTAQPVSV